MAVDLALVDRDPKVAVPRRQPRRGDALHHALLPVPVAHQIADGDERKTVLPGEPDQLRPPCHAAVGREKLAEDAGVAEARQADQIERGLSVSGPAEDAVIVRAKRKDVPGAGELLRPCLGRRERADGERPVLGGGSGRGAAKEIDRNGERRGEARGVERRHEREPQLLEPPARHRHAEKPPPFPGHEVHVLGGHLLRRHDEVPLVFPIFIIHHDDHGPGPNRLKCLFDRGEGSRAARPLAIHRVLPAADATPAASLKYPRASRSFSR